jgi:homoserine O-acetyltransferase
LLAKFPLVTTRDLARAHDLLREELGIKSINALLGASLGGQQALEWSIINPDVIQKLVLIATNAQHSPFGIAFNESQRLAIQTDPTFGNAVVNGAQQGLITARSIAMLSYRSYDGYGQTQAEESNDKSDEFRAASYQRYQGAKLNNRFNAYSYFALTKTMDSHNVGRGRDSVKEALSQVKAKTLVVGIGSDGLFPVREQKFLAHYILDSDYAEIDSAFGHDGFLIETEQLEDLFKDFLFNELKNYKPTVFKSTTKKSELMNLVTKNNKQLNKIAI